MGNATHQYLAVFCGKYVINKLLLLEIRSGMLLISN